VRTIANLGTRYLVMAATGIGVSAFQEPLPASSVLDPWWLAALPIAATAAWRITVIVRARSEEVVYWVAAAAAFGPVSQIFPFHIPFADRYLYFILPGLIGVASFMLVEAYERLGRPVRLRWGTVVVFGLLLIWFGVTSSVRAKLWTNETLLNLDAAKHYPDGGTAAFMAARSAAQRGDTAAAVAFLRKAADRGVDHFATIASDPGLAPVRNSEAFGEFLREMAARSIERTNRRKNPTAPELQLAARAYIVREEYHDAKAMLERALRLGGPSETAVRADLAAVRALLREHSERSRSGETEGVSRRPQER
jgi:hypothetical protein